MNIFAYLLASALSGLAISILSIIDCTSGFNLFFCGWVWVGVFFSVNHYNRLTQIEDKASPAQGALIGGTTGLIAAAVYSILLYYKVMSLGVEELFEVLASTFGMPLEEIYALLPQWDFSAEVTLSIMNFFTNLTIYVIIGVIGGAVSALIIRKRIGFFSKYQEKNETEKDLDSPQE